MCCLFSKTWALRDAAVTKIKLLLQSQFVSQPGIGSVFNAIIAVLKTGLEDKIAQVFFTSAALLEDTLLAIKS